MKPIYLDQPAEFQKRGRDASWHPKFFIFLILSAIATISKSEALAEKHAVHKQKSFPKEIKNQGTKRSSKTGVSFVNLSEIPQGTSVTLPGFVGIKWNKDSEATLQSPDGHVTSLRFDNAGQKAVQVFVMESGAPSKRTVTVLPGSFAVIGFAQKAVRLKVSENELTAMSQDPLQISK
jgi:hypothetical protein